MLQIVIPDIILTIDQTIQKENSLITITRLFLFFF